jgi:hypothetical protein
MGSSKLFATTVCPTACHSPPCDDAVCVVDGSLQLAAAVRKPQAVDYIIICNPVRSAARQLLQVLVI